MKIHKTQLNYEVLTPSQIRDGVFFAYYQPCKSKWLTNIFLGFLWNHLNRPIAKALSVSISWADFVFQSVGNAGGFTVLLDKTENPVVS